MEKDILTNVWPEWKIVRRINRGSFGVVYESVRTDHGVESRAAIKVISIPQDESELDSLRSAGLTEDASRTYFREVVNDFVGEIQIMESFKGFQNIVSVEDYKVIEKTDKVGWDIFIRMELLTPLGAYISDKTMKEPEVIKLGCDLCSALERCAQRNVIHRDIKPDNIFVNEFGDFKLGDFGIARKLENVTGGLSQKGTYNYMAPEVEKGTHYDATVDIYSLGLVLYWLLNRKRLPFLPIDQQLLRPQDLAAANRRRLDGETLPAPCDASREMAEVILTACDPDPARRFATATAMKNALMGVAAANNSQLGNNGAGKEYADGNAGPLNPGATVAVNRAPNGAKPVSQEVRTFGEKETSRRIPVIPVIAVLLILIGAGSFLFVLRRGREENRESDGNMQSTEVSEAESTAEDTEEENESEVKSEKTSAEEPMETAAESGSAEGMNKPSELREAIV